MNLLKIILAITLAFGAYKYWHGHQVAKATREATNANGFVAVPPVQGAAEDTVLVVAAENCPHEDAQRSDRLAQDLARRGIPVRRTHNVGFAFTSVEGDTMDRLNTVMQGPLPIVFVNGRAKGNPSLDEVLDEVKARS